MIRSHTLAIVVVLFISLIGGCMYVPNDPDDPVSVEFHGNFDVSESGFHMDGYVYTIGLKPDKPVVEDVYICLYDDNQSLIEAHRVGDINANSGNVTVTVTSEEIPAYVVPESPDFWSDSFRTRAYRLEDGEYNPYSVYTAEERFYDEEVSRDGYTSCGEQ